MSGGTINEDLRAETRRRVDAVNQRVALSALIGRIVKLRKAGRDYTGLCPFHSENTPSFTVSDDKGFYHCFGCGAHGDAVRFMMQHQGMGFVEALGALEADAGLVRESAFAKRDSVKRKGEAQRYVDGAHAAAMVWRAAQPSRGSIAENWFRARGIDPTLSGILDVVRFHPRCPAQLWRTYEGPGDVRRIAPALVTPLLRIEGDCGRRSLRMTGVHLTFLSGDGREKAYFEPWRDRQGTLRKPPRRMMWGTMKGAAVLFPAAPLCGHSSAADALLALADQQTCGKLLVGEGLESTLSALSRRTDVRMAGATLSLDNMQGSAARVGRNAAISLFNLQGDPESPAPFTFADPGDVVVAVDADMKPDAADKARWVVERRGAAPVKRPLTSLERSEVCAGLARWQWREAGASEVEIMRPPMGCDFNDLDNNLDLGRW